MAVVLKAAAAATTESLPFISQSRPAATYTFLKA